MGFIFRIGNTGQEIDYIGLDYTSSTVEHTNISYYRSTRQFFLNSVNRSEVKVNHPRRVGFCWSRGAVKDASGGVVRSKEFEYVPPVLATTYGAFCSNQQGLQTDFSVVIKSLTLYNLPLTDEQLQELTR